ncbi:MAG TPA: hypothetical protein DCY27_06450 [Desulfobacterales bacterium]|nr:hypothetical protein [Desulfobacterales bacterium]
MQRINNLFNRQLAAATAAVIMMTLTAIGCGKPPVTLNRYLLEYPSPVSGSRPILPDSIRVELFAAVQSLTTTAMIYRPKPYEASSYAYNRWQVSPSHLVTDYLLRDLRNSGLFQGVFGYQQSGGVSRFKLEGAVQEFAEVDAPDGWKAVLAISINLLDTNQEEITRRVIMQRNYCSEESMPDQTPRGLAEGMSRAMERISAQVIADVYQAASRAGR